MRLGSICSGIEAASVAWHPLGWETAYVAEIEPFPCAVLAQRFGAGEPVHLPEGVERKRLKGIAWGSALTNYGDFTRIRENAPDVDVLVGGTPCQAFSIAGARQGLGDARGNLTLEYVRLAHATKSLRYAVWENVPGVLSDDTNAFGCFLGGLVGADAPLLVPGGGRWTDSGMVAGPLGRAAWRIFDAQHFAVAQRRARVFLVFCPRGTAGDPAAILFERKGVPGYLEAGREAGQGIAGGADAGAGQRCAGVAPTLSARTKGGGGLGTDFDCDGGLVEAAGTKHKSHWNGDVHPPLSQGQQKRGGGIGASNQEIFEQGGAGLVATSAYGGGNRSGSVDIAACLVAGGNKQDFEVETFVAHTLRADGFDASEDGTGRGTPPVACPEPIAFSGKDYGADAGPLAPTLRAGGHTTSHQNGEVGPAIAHAFDARQSDVCQYGDKAGALDTDPGTVAPQPSPASAVRRLTPKECERLQAFPDDHTRIQVRFFRAPKISKNRPADMWDITDDGAWLCAADGPRYKALGNSMPVTVMSWIGQRIAAFEAGTLDGWRFDWSLVPWVGSYGTGGGDSVTPILEPGARTGVSTDDPRAGIGIGADGDPMFTLQAGKQHGVGVNFQASQSGVRINETAGTLDANYGSRRHNGVLQ